MAGGARAGPRGRVVGWGGGADGATVVILDQSQSRQSLPFPAPWKLWVGWAGVWKATNSHGRAGCG